MRNFRKPSSHSTHNNSRSSKKISSGLSSFSLFLCLFLAGVLLGSLFFSKISLETQGLLSKILSNDLAVRSTHSYVPVFWTSLSSGLLYLFFIFFLGFCSISLPFLFFVPIIKGMGVGIVYASIYASQGLQGLPTILLLLPNILLTALVVISSCKESSFLSITSFRRLFLEEGKTLGHYIQHYLFQFACYFIFLVFSSALDALLSLFIV